MGKKYHKDITKELIEKLYVEEGKTLKECGEVLNLTAPMICLYLKKFGIKARPAMTERTKTKISAKAKGRTSAMKGRKLSDEAKAKISKANRRRFKKPSEFGGHRKRRPDGYISIFCPDHPNATKDGHVLEHVLIMERAIGRYLEKDEVVHHKNHIRDDNRLENLELMTFREHARLHMNERWQEKRKNEVKTNA